MINTINGDIIYYITKQLEELYMGKNNPNSKGQSGKQVNNSSKSGTTRSDSKSTYITEKAVSNPAPGKGGKK